MSTIRKNYNQRPYPEPLPPSYDYRYQDAYKYETPLPAKQNWSEQIAYEKNYIDWYPEQKINYVPMEKKYTDYIEIEHETDYIPVPRLNKNVEYIPVDRYEEFTEYMPYERSYVKSKGGRPVYNDRNYNAAPQNYEYRREPIGLPQQSYEYRRDPRAVYEEPNYKPYNTAYKNQIPYTENKGYNPTYARDDSFTRYPYGTRYDNPYERSYSYNKKY